MTQYWLDLTQPAVDVLAELTIVNPGAGAVLDVVDDGGTTALFFESIGEASSVIYDTAGQRSGVTQVLAYCRFGTPANSYPLGLGLNLQPQGAGNAEGYGFMAGASGGADDFHLFRFDSGLINNLAEDNSTGVANNTYHWQLFEIDGTTIRGKVWNGDYSDIPPGWNLELTDATYAAGGMGLLSNMRAINKDIWCASLSVGTDGDPAPDTGVTPPIGTQEMYIKDGGIFVKYTPYVKVGGTFQEVDAYVLDGGAWKPVHEK